MKVLVAGAAGAVGRQLLPQLTERGHQVVGMTRSAGKAELVRELGAEPVVADALDPEQVARAVAEAEPEAIVPALGRARDWRGALERGRSGIYNIVDDDPAPVRDWLPAVASALGAKPPRHVPRWVGRLLAGEAAAVMMTEVRGASNEKAKRELGWLPRHPSWRTGFTEAT